MLDSPATSKAPLLLLAPLALAAGCYVDADLDDPAMFEDGEVVESTTQALCQGQMAANGRCSSCGWDCPANGERIGGYWFDELYISPPASGTAILRFPNAQGYFFKRFVTASGKELTLEMDGDRIVGKRMEWVYDPQSRRYEYRENTYEGAALSGASFVLGLNGSPDREMHVIIEEEDRTSIDYLVAPAPMTAYLFRYEIKQTDGRKLRAGYLCKPTSEFVWMPTYEPVDTDYAVVFTGNRFNADQKTASTDSSGRWLNFGCANGIAAKAHRMRYTRSAASAGTYSREKLQAAVKMLAGDFCGDGSSLTVTGEYIRWRDNGVMYPPTPEGAPVDLIHANEARWDEGGATCLMPRWYRRYDDPVRSELLDASCGDKLEPCYEYDYSNNTWVYDSAPYYFSSSVYYVTLPDGGVLANDY